MKAKSNIHNSIIYKEMGITFSINLLYGKFTIIKSTEMCCKNYKSKNNVGHSHIKIMIPRREREQDFS